MHVLSSKLRLRVEREGGVVLNTTNLNVHFFNDSAIRILRFLVEPKSDEELAAFLGHKNDSIRVAHEFLSYCRSIGLVKDEAELSKAEVYELSLSSDEELDFATPVACELEVTRKCMRQCDYCSYESGPLVDTSRELTANEWLLVIAKLKQAGVFALRITGGDPLSYQHIDELVSSDVLEDMQIVFASDLTVSRFELLQKMFERPHFIGLITTLDGSNSEVADRFRGRGNFRRVTSAIEKLRSINVPTIVGTIVTKINYDDIYDTAKILNELGVRKYSISELYPAGRANLMREFIPSEREMKIAQKQYYHACDVGLVEPVNPGADFHIENRNFNSNEANGKTSEAVGSPDAALRIDSQGRMYVSIKLLQCFGEETYIGNALTDDVAHVWQNHPQLKQLRRLATPNYRFRPQISFDKLERAIGGSRRD